MIGTHELHIHSKHGAQGPRHTMGTFKIPTIYLSRMIVWEAKQCSLQNLWPIGECPLHPGKMCCVNQMLVGCPSLPYTMHGQWSQQCYTACTFFVDVTTCHIFPHFQESTNAIETLQGKMWYEQYCQCYHCTVQEYCSDNGIFTDCQFTKQLAHSGQWQTVTGVGTHHMNGIVKQSISFISTWMLTMLLHTKAQWPQVINKEFWPFVMWHAINIYINCYRRCHGTAVPPIEEFTNAPAPLQVHDLHPWGCPIYVLDKHLQDGDSSQSKWDRWSWLGIYVGHSTIHSGNVVLVYNPLTGHTTPQFHVVFDDYFQTIAPHLSSAPHTEIDALFWYPLDWFSMDLWQQYTPWIPISWNYWSSHIQCYWQHFK